MGEGVGRDWLKLDGFGGKMDEMGLMEFERGQMQTLVVLVGPYKLLMRPLV